MINKDSAALIAQIDQLAVPHGQLALWALGQSGFVLKGGDAVVYIDPYLSNAINATGGPARRFPPPIAPDAIHHARYVFATHEHADHADGATLGPLMAASPQATLITSPQGRAIALEADVPAARIATPRLGKQVQLRGLTHTPVPAAHYNFEVDEAGHARWMGFLIVCNGVTVYHAGDTLVFPELLEALHGQQIDLALLPLNGRDFPREARGLVGNMWPSEGIDLAQRIGANVLLGTHNDLFAENRLPAGLLFEELDRHAPFQRCHVLQPGELYLYAG